MIEKINKILEKLPEEYRDSIREIVEIIIKEEIEQNRKMIQELWDIIREGNRVNERLWKTVEILGQRVDNLTQAVSELRQITKEQGEKIMELTQAVNELRQITKEQGEKIMELTQAVSELRQITKEQGEKIMELTQAVSELRQITKEQGEKIMELTQAVSELRQVTKEQGEKIMELTQAVNELRQITKEQGEKIMELTQAVSELRQVTKEQGEKIMELTQAVNELRQVTKEQGERIDRLEKALIELTERVNNLTQAIDELRQAIKESNERMDKIEQRVETGFKDLKKYIDDKLSEFGSRWGIKTERSFIGGIKNILEDIGYKVEKVEFYDDEGYVFSYPTTIEIDLLISNGKTYAIEIKSTLSEGDVLLFGKKVDLYERKFKKVINRRIIITSFVRSRKVLERAKKFKIDVIKDVKKLSL
ncbi:MAG: DUF3782 domain-containing protein [candidate division WOR-3 bacterium]